MPFQKEVETFLASAPVKDLSPTTQKNYRYALQHFDGFYKRKEGARTPMLETVTEETLSSFVEYLNRRKKSGSTIQQYLTIVKMMLRFHKKPIEFRYRRSSTDKKKQQVKEIARWFSDEDIQKCLEYDFPGQSPDLQLRNQLLVRLVAETGARIQEIARITGRDFDTENNTVFLKTSKTEPRPAFYSKATAILVDSYFDQQANILTGSHTEDFFPTTDQCQKIIAAMLKDLGLKNEKDGRGPHTFRHYVATKLYFDGNMDLTHLAILLGDKPETIRNTYLHPTPAMLRRRAAMANGWLETAGAATV